ncbi:Protein [Escherichia coli]
MLAISSNISKMVIFIFAIIIVVFLCVTTYLYLHKDESLVSKHYINYMAIPESDGFLHGSQIFFRM